MSHVKALVTTSQSNADGYGWRNTFRHKLPSIEVPVSDVPGDQTVVFKNSSFFAHNGDTSTRPSPIEVLEQVQKGAANMLHVVPFPSLNLLVKFGRQTSIAEGQCLWAIRRLLPHIVSVPGDDG